MNQMDNEKFPDNLIYEGIKKRPVVIPLCENLTTDVYYLALKTKLAFWPEPSSYLH